LGTDEIPYISLVIPRSINTKVLDPMTWTNGVISLYKDIVFGVCVLTDDGWVPFSSGSEADKNNVRRLVDYAPSCPFKAEIYK
jgi:hypothetical protein